MSRPRRRRADQQPQDSRAARELHEKAEALRARFDHVMTILEAKRAAVRTARYSTDDPQSRLPGEGRDPDPA